MQRKGVVMTIQATRPTVGPAQSTLSREQRAELELEVLRRQRPDLVRQIEDVVVLDPELHRLLVGGHWYELADELDHKADYRINLLAEQFRRELL